MEAELQHKAKVAYENLINVISITSMTGFPDIARMVTTLEKMRVMTDKNQAFQSYLSTFERLSDEEQRFLNDHVGTSLGSLLNYLVS